MEQRIVDRIPFSLRWMGPGFAALACLIIAIAGAVTGTILDARSIEIYKAAPTINVSFTGNWSDWSMPNVSSMAVTLEAGETYLVAGRGFLTTTYVSVDVSDPYHRPVSLTSASGKVRGGNILASFVAPVSGDYVIDAMTQQLSATLHVYPERMTAIDARTSFSFTVAILAFVASIILLVIWTRIRAKYVGMPQPQIPTNYME